MRHTDRIFEEGFELSNLVNVVSVKIVSSDYGYPLNVYGTVLARDSLDRQCVYLFRRDKDNCQLISSKVLPFFQLLNESSFYFSSERNHSVGDIQ